MVNDSHKHLYWTKNRQPFLGYGPGELLVVDYHSGGGFAGAPEVLEVGLTKGIAEFWAEEPKWSDFPSPSTDVEYRVGGRMFNGYHYFDARTLER